MGLNGLPLDIDEQEQLEKLGRSRIAPPNLGGGALPPTTARGLNIPLGSPEELENRAASLRLRPAPIAKPGAAAEDAEKAQDEIARLRSTGSGISQIKSPTGRGVLRGLNIAGTVASSLVPGVRPLLNAIPGTEEHHNALIRQQTGRLGEDLKEQESEAAIGKTAADTEEAEARAEEQRAEARAKENPPDKATKPEPVFDKDGNIIGFNTGTDLLSLTSPSLTPDMKAMAEAAKPKTNEQEKPLAERVEQLNQMLTSRYQVLNPGKPLPPQYTLSKGATKADFDRIDKGLESEERAKGTKAQQEQANEMRRQTLALAQHKETEKDEEKTRQANSTIRSFTRYQGHFKELSPKLTDKDREAMQVLSSHQEGIAHGMIESAQSGVLDAMLGEPMTGYSEKLMGGAMTKDQYDKLSPAGKQLLADYFHAIIANFINMKQRMGTAGSRNQAMVQAEMNAIPLPYIDAQSADNMFNDTIEDIRNSSPGATEGEAQTQPRQRRVIDLTVK